MVLIPSAVYEEVVTSGIARGHHDAYTVEMAIIRQELTLVNVEDTDLSQELQTLPLGSGERQVIYLASRESANIVLLDDLLAREEATRRGLKVKGTLGVIVEARLRGILNLEECNLIFEAISSRSDIWLSEALVRQVWETLRKQ